MVNLSRFAKIFGVLLILFTCLAAIAISVVGREFKDSGYDFFISSSTSLESIFYDFRLKTHLAEENKKIYADEKLAEDVKSENIILVKIDDDSLARIGTYPVPRDNWARLIDNLKSFGAKIVAFDVFYPEKSKSCTYEESPDLVLAQSIVNFQSDGESKVIIPYTTSPYEQDATEEFPDELWNFLLDSQSESDEYQLAKEYVNRHNFPIKELAETQVDLAYIMMEEDRDGVFRHYPVVKNLMEGMYFPSLATRAYQSFTGKKVEINVGIHHTGAFNINDEQNIYINHYGETKIRWYGADDLRFPAKTLQEVLFADPNDKELKKFFDNKIVFIGSTALGAHDFRNTPVDPKTPGVYAHMNMLYMLLNNYFYKDLYESMKYTMFILLASMLILMIVMYFGNPIIDFLTLAGLIASIYYADFIYFLPIGYELRLFFTFVSLVLSYSWITGINFSQSNKDKKKIKGAFSRYVAPSIVNDMLDHPDKLKVGGERRDITCMFSDVRDFTSISEMLTANQLASALNRYMGEMTDIVFATNGTLDKYIGDAIVAFWGAPLDIGDHVTQAVDAGVKMLEALPAINAEFKEKDLPEFKIGLGLNSGECNVGNMGSDQIFAYTALGDTMNLGARLESSCKFYGAQILISEYTYDRMDKSKFTTRLIDFVQVKGKTEPVKVYEVLYSYHPLMQDLESLNTFKEGYQDFVDKNFKEAIAKFNKVLEKAPEDKSSLRLKENCEEYLENPPAEGTDHTITVRTDK
jgi:adenylate cyclase